MPLPSLFPCPRCRLIHIVETLHTEPSPPIVPTDAIPEPPHPHAERKRYCNWCGCRFRTTEKVIEIEGGDADRIDEAMRAVAGDETVSLAVRLLVRGDRDSVAAAHVILRTGRDPRRDPNERLLFEMDEFEFIAVESEATS